MRVFLVAAAAVLLCSCASEGQFRTSTSVNGQSFGSMDLTDPHYYMNDDAPPPSAGSAYAPAVPHYGIDSYCGYCQRRGGLSY